MSTTRLDDGLAVRRRVLGDEYVDRSLRNATAFTQPLQDLIGEYCWGTVWTREGLPLTTRSLLNLAMLTALGKTDELKLHARGALRNGCAVDEIRETLLQATVYCGVPAGLEAFRAVQPIIDDAGD